MKHCSTFVYTITILSVDNKIITKITRVESFENSTDRTDGNAVFVETLGYKWGEVVLKIFEVTPAEFGREKEKLYKVLTRRGFPREFPPAVLIFDKRTQLSEYAFTFLVMQGQEAASSRKDFPLSFQTRPALCISLGNLRETLTVPMGVD